MDDFNALSPAQQAAILGGEFGPAKITVRFMVGAVQNEQETLEKGYPVFFEHDMISKHVAGEKDFISSYVDADVDPKRYPREWAEFQESKKRRPPIPLTALPKMRAGVYATLKALDIHTVDDLLAKDVPEDLAEYKTWALHLKRLHDFAHGGQKPRIKLAA
jgi:hypothetical protein